MKYIFFVISASLCLLSCEPKVVDIKIPDHQSKVVVHAELNPEQSLFSVWISKTVGILDSSKLDTLSSNYFMDSLSKGIYGTSYWIPDANIQLFGDGQLLGTLQPNPSLRTYELNFNTPPTATEYELAFDIPELGNASGVQIAPKSIPNCTALFSNDGGTDFNGYPLDLLRVSIDDPADEDNYYEIYLYVYTNPNSPFGQENLYPYLFSDDPTIISVGRGVIISDKGFNGNVFTGRISAFETNFKKPDYDSIYSAKVYVRNITQDRYLYLKSYNTYRETAGNPFAEPSNLYTNIKNGRGIFYVFKEQEIELK